MVMISTRGTPKDDIQIAIISFFLGLLFGVSLLLLALFLWYGESAIPLSLLALSCYFVFIIVPFHFLEFYCSTQYRPHIDRGPHTFMIFHSKEYLTANAVSYLEFFVEVWLVPDAFKLFHMTPHTIILTSILAFLPYYVFRIRAMAHAGVSFSLEVEEHSRRKEHVLVTTGPYAWMRHPSYCGWFWRTSISQLVLMNPISFVLFTVATWYFFFLRIREEERALESDEFFGEEYVKYKKQLPSGIPFIP